MVQTTTIDGIRRTLFLFRLKFAIFFHFLPHIIRLPLRRFILFYRRLLFFLSHLHHNKYANIDGKVRLDLYIPSFPGRAFYTACEKFLTFDTKLPCSTVLLSVTSACRFRCRHCYQRRDTGSDVALDLLVGAAQTLQERGVAFFNIEGGEPFLAYERLRAVCEALDERSEIWVNSTGDGMTSQRIAELKKRHCTAVMFSLHAPEPDSFNCFMGSDKAWECMRRGIDCCHENNVIVAFNMCLTAQAFYNGTFEQCMERVREFGGSILQLIKPKRAGAWLEKGAEPFSDADLGRVRHLVDHYNHHPSQRNYPPISAQIAEEDPGVFGCTAGGTDRFYINAQGDVQPCEFLNISFGNIAEQDFLKIYNSMRSFFEKPGTTWLCEACAENIADTVKKNERKSLPLSPKLSESIYSSWDRGAETRLYRVVEQEMR